MRVFVSPFAYLSALIIFGVCTVHSQCSTHQSTVNGLTMKGWPKNWELYI